MLNYDVECPYCGEGQYINHDDGYGYSENETYEQECYHCEKTFAYTTGYIVVYETFQADCLNGGEHRIRENVCVPDCYRSFECIDCGYKGLEYKGKSVYEY